MPDADQCPSHTRTPWGSSPHRMRPSLRHLAMGLLVFAFVAVVVLVLVFVIGHSTFWANHKDHKLEEVTAAGGIALVMDQHGEKGQLGGREEDSMKRDAERACAEELKGCIAEGWSNFCCPHGTIGQNNPFSRSGISCCPPSALCDLDSAPACLAGTASCPASLGGGCCPTHSACSSEGCLIEFFAPLLEDDWDQEKDILRQSAIVKAQVPTLISGFRPTAVESSAMVTHTGTKFGELAVVLEEDYVENMVRAREPLVVKPGDLDGGVTVEAGRPDAVVGGDDQVGQTLGPPFTTSPGSKLFPFNLKALMLACAAALVQ